MLSRQVCERHNVIKCLSTPYQLHRVGSHDLQGALFSFSLYFPLLIVPYSNIFQKKRRAKKGSAPCKSPSIKTEEEEALKKAAKLEEKMFRLMKAASAKIKAESTSHQTLRERY